MSLQLAYITVVSKAVVGSLGLYWACVLKVKYHDINDIANKIGANIVSIAMATSAPRSKTAANCR